MPLDLLKMLPGTLPRLFDSAAEVQKVSKLVFAELVEAEFESAGQHPNYYRGPQRVTVFAITELGWITLAQDGREQAALIQRNLLGGGT